MDSRAGFKWWILLCLVIPTIFTVILLIASLKGWTFSAGASDFIRANRASIQLVIQLISSLLALIHSLCVCLLLQYGGRLYLAARESVRIDHLKGWGSMAAAKIELGVPLLYLVGSTIVASISIVSSALWVGAMTPVESISTNYATLDVPVYANMSLLYEYPSEVGESGPEVYTREGLFSYAVGIKYISLLMSSAASATTSDGSLRQHSKPDNTQFAYLGRSYGIGAGVGIKDHGISGDTAGGRPRGYEYVETGYETIVSCIYNDTARFVIGDNDFNHLIYPAIGWLPDSTYPETSDYFGRGTNVIVALGAAGGPPRPRFVGIAAGAAYKSLNTVQCSVDFLPARFRVKVDLGGRNITVTKFEGGAGGGESTVPDMDPTSGLAKATMRQFQVASNDLTNLYVSVLGDALLSSVAAWNVAHNVDGSHSEEEVTLAGVENAIVAMADDILTLYGAAQLIVGNFSQPTEARVSIAVLQVGQRPYALAILALNAAIVAAAVIELVRTRAWRDLPEFDYTDMAWVLLASFRGGAMSAGSQVVDGGSGAKGERGSLLQTHQTDGEGIWGVGGEKEGLIVELKQLDETDSDIVLIVKGQ